MTSANMKAAGGAGQHAHVHSGDGVGKGLAPFVYKGQPIRDRGEMVSLTDMWHAAGAVENREPFNWSRKEGAAFVEAVALAHNLPDRQVMFKKQGKSGGTWAHWQIAMAYAKYLSHDFHMWANTVVRERMEGRGLPPPLVSLETAIIAIGDRIAALERIVALQARVVALPAPAEALDAAVEATLARKAHYLVRGKTAGQIWQARGYPPLKSIAGWFGNRLKNVGCALDNNSRVEMGVSRARLFDPDKAETWLANGGAELVKQKIAERQGQRVIRLVGGKNNGSRKFAGDPPESAG